MTAGIIAFANIGPFRGSVFIIAGATCDLKPCNIMMLKISINPHNNMTLTFCKKSPRSAVDNIETKRNGNSCIGSNMTPREPSYWQAHSETSSVSALESMSPPFSNLKRGCEVCHFCLLRECIVGFVDNRLGTNRDRVVGRDARWNALALLMKMRPMAGDVRKFRMASR